MIRVLCIVSAMNAGGAETFLMKLYRRMDKTRYQMDFCVNVETEGLYDSEIRSAGGRIYRIPSKSENLAAFSKQFYQIVKSNRYTNVLRVTSNAMGFYDLCLAKMAGATNCMARSSNSSDGGSLKSRIAHQIGKLLFKKYIDVKIAPSDLAAIYTFGKKDYKDGKVQILRNGIDFQEYKFSHESRERIRNDLGIAEDTFLIGHIGRFSKQKNHAFLLELFSEVHNRRNNTALLLVGDGELQADVKRKAAEYGLERCVLFAGVRIDIPALLSAMDVFVLPSLYEGMPNVLIEAQAAGLPCLASDSITKECAITDLVKQLPINSLSDWANAIDEEMQVHANDGRANVRVPDSYDIQKVASIFTGLLV